MKANLIISILTLAWLCCCGQKNNLKTAKISYGASIIDSTKYNSKQLSPKQEVRGYIYTDTTYASSTGTGITIQNSLPKGGSITPEGEQYLDSLGKSYAFAVFWTRIVNETSTPIELTINFPAASFPIFTPPNSYLRLFLPTDSFTYDKLSSYNYGLTEVKSFLDTNFDKATEFQKTIDPDEEHIFYVTALSYEAGGTPRAALIMKQNDLYYKMSISPHGSGTIPFGKIAFAPEPDK